MILCSPRRRHGRKRPPPVADTLVARGPVVVPTVDETPEPQRRRPRNTPYGMPVRTSRSRPREPPLAMQPTSTTTKHIFVTGGVASSLGKGLTASSLGAL